MDWTHKVKHFMVLFHAWDRFSQVIQCISPDSVPDVFDAFRVF